MKLIAAMLLMTVVSVSAQEPDRRIVMCGKPDPAWSLTVQEACRTLLRNMAEEDAAKKRNAEGNAQMDRANAAAKERK